MSKLYKKPYRIRKKKSILRNRFFWTGFLAVIILFFVSYFLFFSNIFQIQKIIITEGEGIGEENLKTFIPQNNIFLVDAQKIREDILDNFPQIAEVEIHRGFPDTLNILITERLAVAVWCEAETEKCFLMDKEGVIFGEVLIPSEVEGLSKIVGAKEALGKEKISQILDIQTKLKESFNITSTQAFIASEERLNIKTSEGWEIYFNLKGNLDWQLQELGLVLEKQIPLEKKRILEYIDLRFSRVFYR